MQHTPDCIRSWVQQQPETPDYDKLYQQSMEALSTYPHEREYLLAFAAFFLARANKGAQAIEHCRQYLPALTVAECINDMTHTLTRALEDAGDIEGAIGVLEEHIAKVEDPYHTYIDIMELSVQVKDHDRTIKYGVLVTQDNFCDAEVYEWMAQAYEAKKQYVESHDCLVKAAQAVPDSTSWLWSNAGRALALADQVDEAMFYFKMALKINPENEMAHYYMGQSYQNKEDVYRALHHYTEALKLKPDFPEVYNNLAAISYHENSNISEAISNLEKALQASPDKNLLTRLYINLVRLYKSIADYEREEYYKDKMMEALGFGGFDIDDDGEDPDIEDEDSDLLN